jgi:hypothetical protein
MNNIFIVISLVAAVFFYLKMTGGGLSGAVASAVVFGTVLVVLQVLWNRRPGIDALPYHAGPVLHGVNSGESEADRNQLTCDLARVPANKLNAASSMCGTGASAARTQCLEANNLVDPSAAQLCRENNQLGGLLKDIWDDIKRKLL